MPEFLFTPLERQVDDSPEARATYCAQKYDLRGPQVDPGASFYLDCFARNPLRLVTVAEITARVPAAQNPFPTQALAVKRELQELIELARLRDEPGVIAQPKMMAAAGMGERRPLSLFLNLRPQPLGTVINTARGEAAPVIATGRELARTYENETPGLTHQLVLNFLFANNPGVFSPPRQALIWAGLFITIASALSAAWFYKWRGGPGVQFRRRPWECDNRLDVLYDRVPNSTNSGDAQRRGFPPGVQPMPAEAGELKVPESLVTDILPPPGGVPATGFNTPGTPRHPAYPSGHSTYSAAASRFLYRMFPAYTEDLLDLADNIGLARMWAGIHYRSDHTFGIKVGEAVADLVIDQLFNSGVFKPGPTIGTPPVSTVLPPERPTTDPNDVTSPCPPGGKSRETLRGTPAAKRTRKRRGR